MPRIGKAVFGLFLGLLSGPAFWGGAPAAAQNAFESAIDSMAEQLRTAADGRFHVVIEGRKGDPAAGTLEIDYISIAWNKGRHALEINDIKLDGVKADGNRLTHIGNLTTGTVRLEIENKGAGSIFNAVGAKGKALILGDIAQSIGALAEDAGAARLLVAVLDGLSAESLVLGGTSIKVHLGVGVVLDGRVSTMGVANLADGKADLAMKGMTMGGDMASMASGPKRPRKFEVAYKLDRTAYRQVDLKAYAQLIDVYVDFIGNQIAVAPAVSDPDSVLRLKANVRNMVRMGELLKTLSYGPGSVDNMVYRIDMDIDQNQAMSWTGSMESLSDLGFADGIAKGVTVKKLGIATGGSSPGIDRIASKLTIREMQTRGFNVHGYMMRIAQMAAFFTRMAGADVTNVPEVRGSLIDHFAIGGVNLSFGMAPTQGTGAPFRSLDVSAGVEVFLVDKLGRGMAERVALKNATFTANSTGEGFNNASVKLFDARMVANYMDLNQFRYGPLLEMFTKTLDTGGSGIAGFGRKDKPTLAEMSKRPFDPTAILSYVRRSVMKGFSLDVNTPQMTVRSAMESDLAMTPDLKGAKGVGAMRVILQVPKTQANQGEWQLALGDDNTLDMTVRYDVKVDVPTRRIIEAIDVAAQDLANLRFAFDFSGVEYLWRAADLALLGGAERDSAMSSPLGFGNAMLHEMELTQEDTGLLARLRSYLAKQKGVSVDQAVDAWATELGKQAEGKFPGDTLVKEFTGKLAQFVKQGGKFSILLKPRRPVPIMTVARNIETKAPQAIGQMLGVSVEHSK